MKIRYTYKVTVTTDEESGADNEKALQTAADAIDLDGCADVTEHNAEEVENDEPKGEPEEGTTDADSKTSE